MNNEITEMKTLSIEIPVLEYEKVMAKAQGVDLDFYLKRAIEIFWNDRMHAPNVGHIDLSGYNEALKPNPAYQIDLSKPQLPERAVGMSDAEWRKRQETHKAALRLWGQEQTTERKRRNGDFSEVAVTSGIRHG